MARRMPHTNCRFLIDDCRFEYDEVSDGSSGIEEVDENGYWMELIIEGELLPKEKVDSLLDEANQLTAIMVASRETAKGE